jgi:predicted Zn-dependent peptidase
MFQIVATAAPGQSVEALRAAVLDELERLRHEGPSEDELARGAAQAEATFVYRLQSLGGFGGKADQLNAYNVYQGNPDGFDADLARYLSATRDRVRDAVRTWLDPARAAILTVVPSRP